MSLFTRNSQVFCVVGVPLQRFVVLSLCVLSIYVARAVTAPSSARRRPTAQGRACRGLSAQREALPQPPSSAHPGTTAPVGPSCRVLRGDTALQMAPRHSPTAACVTPARSTPSSLPRRRRSAHGARTGKAVTLEQSSAGPSWCSRMPRTRCRRLRGSRRVQS